MRNANDWLAIGKTAHSAALLSSLDYLMAVRDMLLGRVRPQGVTGALSDAELDEMDQYRAAGWTVEAFVNLIVERDARALRTKMEIGNVQRFLRDYCNGVAANERPLEAGRVV